MSQSAMAEAELERFRRQWREEVSSRQTKPRISDRPQRQEPVGSAASTSHHSKAVKHIPSPNRQDLALGDIYHESPSGGPVFHDLPDKEENETLGAADKGLIRASSVNEPGTALEHYEKAVENETAGKLGDSLKLYRAAFKLDENVHEKYKNKHFPPSASTQKATQPSQSNAPVAVSGHTGDSPGSQVMDIAQLIQSFSGLTIPGAAPPTDASPPPPCPISELPNEIITQILHHTALTNIASFARVAQVCKHFAYLTKTEEQIWRAVTLSYDQGFGSMHYRFSCDMNGVHTDYADVERPLGTDGQSPDEEESTRRATSIAPSDITTHLHTTLYDSSWRQMFRIRPRIRFHGVYISTVNYTRPGGASTTLNTWTTPVLVVTYYRYLRFYRDGSCISLLTTAEPIDVVHILTKENLPEQSRNARQHRNHHAFERTHASKPPPTSIEKSGSSQSQAQAAKTEAPHALPSSQIMRDALRGRWRLSGPGDGTYPRPASDVPADEVETEGDLIVETEGVVPKYMYKMQFAIGSSSVSASANTAVQAGQSGTAAGGRKGARNNKLAWKGFWSYNRLTDDWGEFGLKNDRGFYWSQVKSYGMGG